MHFLTYLFREAINSLIRIHRNSQITVLRNDMVKISRSRFIFACRFIRDVEHAAQKDT